MNRMVYLLLGLICPGLLFAADSSSSLTFAPPPGDASVVFLGNIFGAVDGVLHGTGSQIMGEMFRVFNAAVMSIGACIISYTLVVSTLNTANEGQLLGQKWSSIWVPMRSVLGMAAMLPKASGYSVIQIFVMWIVIQGIGAADKIWETALGYLNRGGVIIHTNQTRGDNGTLLANDNVMQGAKAILSGQVCMLGIQKALEAQRESNLNAPAGGESYCSGASGDAKDFCTNSVPSFISSVNFLAAQKNNSDPNVPNSIKMPNFGSTNPFYSKLDGICGSVSWKSFVLPKDTSKTSPSQGDYGLSSDDLAATTESRAIALQQMYNDLAVTSETMVNSGWLPFAKGALTEPLQFGIPLLKDGSTPCDKGNKTDCTNWGKDPSVNLGGPVFNGTEFQGAIADYNTIMFPSMNLLDKINNAQVNADSKAFIQDANSAGWILAGSYFYRLVALSTQTKQRSIEDTDSGLQNSQGAEIDKISNAFNGSVCTGDSEPAKTLCTWLTPYNKDPIDSIHNLMGQAVKDEPVQGRMANTVNGFIGNSKFIVLPNQPGTDNLPEFKMILNIPLDVSSVMLPKIETGCAGFMCIPGAVGQVMYNNVWRYTLNIFLSYTAKVINALLITIVSIPLTLIAAAFIKGIHIIQNADINPVVALAEMGVQYINLAMDITIKIFIAEVIHSLLPYVGMLTLFPVLLLCIPLVFSWIAVMFSIGILTAYYIPFLPFMIFTFGAIAWLMVVIEAMAAAPIVALGVMHPEGHEAFGKGEAAIGIILNVFLRPSMMIIGYIAAIILSYVSVWVINAGFSHAMDFLWMGSNMKWGQWANKNDIYVSWAGLYSIFFAMVIYISMYITAVQQSFTLITIIPDRILRWIGFQTENAGEQAVKWAEESKGRIEDAGKQTYQAEGQTAGQMKATGGMALTKAKQLGGGGGGGSLGKDPLGGASSTPSPPPGGSGAGAGGGGAGGGGGGGG